MFCTGPSHPPPSTGLQPSIQRGEMFCTGPPSPQPSNATGEIFCPRPPTPAKLNLRRNILYRSALPPHTPRGGLKSEPSALTSPSRRTYRAVGESRSKTPFERSFFLLYLNQRICRFELPRKFRLKRNG